MLGFRVDRLKQNDADRARAQRLFRHVDVLAGLIGERNCWKYDQLMAAERYVRDELAKTGLAVTEQAYSVMGKTVRNVILEQKGTKRADEIIVLGGHYDSVDGTPGADDNASAVAGLLEVAQTLTKRRFQRTLRYVAFVNEEPPFYKSEDMGSLRYATQCRERGEKIIGMVNLEMLGYFSDRKGSQEYPAFPGGLRRLNAVLPKRGNFIVVCSDMASARFLAKFAFHFRRHARVPMIAFPSPRWITGPGMSDNWSFWEVGYPAVMVTDTSFYRNKHYHMSTDKPETLCYPMMARVVHGVEAAIARLARSAS